MSGSAAGADGGLGGASPSEPAAPAADAASRVEAIVAQLVLSPQPASSAVKRALIHERRDLVVQALSSAARRQTEWNRYARVVNMLARLDDEQALQALRDELTRKSPFAIHAVRAVGRMTVEGAECVLLEVVQSGRAAPRRAAARSLAARRVGRVVAPLSRLALRGRARTPDPNIVQALRSMGSLRDLHVYLLADDSMDTVERVEAIENLEALQRYLRMGRFNAMRLLEQEASDPRCAWREAAADAARLYHARKTLLRPADRAPSDSLVRPASGPDRTSSDRLVRPVEDATETSPTSEQPDGLWHSLAQRIRDLFDGD